MENHDWQEVSGWEFFEHEMSIDPSRRTQWRKRLG
jgi:hypothetical protein